MVKDAMLDPESKAMYTDSDSSDDDRSGARKLKSNKIRGRKGGTTLLNFMQRRPPNGGTNSDVEEET